MKQHEAFLPRVTGIGPCLQPFLVDVFVVNVTKSRQSSRGQFRGGDQQDPAGSVGWPHEDS